MKREHETTEDYIKWLKSLGCVLYMPLQENGDYLDYITGTEAVQSGYGSIAWDNNVNMNLWTTDSNINRSVLSLGTGMRFMNTATLICKAKKHSSGGFCVFDNNYTRNMFGFQINGLRSNGTTTAYSENWVSYEPFYYSIVISSNGRKIYVNDSLLVDDSYVYGPYDAVDTLGIGGSLDSNRTSKIYCSDIYCFNTALDLATIRKIQGYE